MPDTTEDMYVRVRVPRPYDYRYRRLGIEGTTIGTNRKTRLSQIEDQVITRAAEKLGCTVSWFLRTAALEMALAVNGDDDGENSV